MMTGRIQDSGCGIQEEKHKAFAEKSDASNAIPESCILNPESQEIGGRKGPSPTRYGDWEKDGRAVDF